MITKTLVKVSTKAIERNCKLGRGMQPRDYEPAIVLGFFDETGARCETMRVHRIGFNCPAQLIQNDPQPGFSARVWLELMGVPAILPPIWNKEQRPAGMNPSGR